MIELVIAALLQVATITTDASADQTYTTQDAATTTEAQKTDGGTGAWDDNG